MKIAASSAGALAVGLVASGISANADSTYTVKTGDTLSEIAQKNNVTVSDLATKNNISDANKILPGVTLTIEGEGQQAQTSNSSGSYTVKAGDTLGKIASENGTTVSELRSANNLSSDLILVGQVLQLHGNGSTNTGAQQTQATTTATVDNQVSTTQTQNYTQPSYNYQQQTTNGYSSNYSNNYSNNASTQSATQSATVNNYGGSTSEQAAKEWIAQRESGGSYNARNGRYIGRYQLTDSYLGGDYSAANQERVANNYVTSRYGSWAGAKDFWQSHGWY
ncbi:aggregation promoting factor [Ligilactobacillus equi DSM 15833 = JCM 10991]|nr:aggregation promoting factor [Ligilactobacillus equi DSM 15833 = JCM 10991]